MEAVNRRRELEFHADEVEEVADDEYVAVTQDSFVDTVIDEFRRFEPRADETTIYYLYVTDNYGRLVGVMSLRELLNAPEDDVVEDHMETDLVSIDADPDPEIAAGQMADLDFPALPVVDDEGVLESAASDVPPAVDVDTEFVVGEPGRAIVRYTDEHDVEQVVIGSHGRERIARFLLGSVAETVVRRSVVPVTVVRPDG